MKKLDFRKIRTTMVVAAMLSVGAMAGVSSGTVSAVASGCSNPYTGANWTRARCTTLTSPNSMRAKQWCTSVGYGFMYGGFVAASNTNSDTLSCPGGVSAVTSRTFEIY